MYLENKNHNNKVVLVLANIMRFLQPLDLLVDLVDKILWTRISLPVMPMELKQTIEKGILTESIENNLSQTQVKPVHVNFLIWIYFFFTSDEVKIMPNR